MILFLDIDGVLLPGRAYCLSCQTKPMVTQFDPCVVGMLNKLGSLGAKFVIHSSWLRIGVDMLNTYCQTDDIKDVKEHMVQQGLLEKYFHEDHSVAYRFSGTRWLAITEWLDRHPEITDYRILEDEAYPGEYGLNYDWIVQTEFNEGLTFNQYMNLRTLFEDRAYGENYGLEENF